MVISNVSAKVKSIQGNVFVAETSTNLLFDTVQNLWKPCTIILEVVIHQMQPQH